MMIVTEETCTIVVSERGSPGRNGDPGPSGPSGASYRHDQGVPDLVWTITHGLGYMPAGVYVEDSAGSTNDPAINHIDLNTIELTFVGATDGFALLS